jgi:hypothetical protein
MLARLTVLLALTLSAVSATALTRGEAETRVRGFDVAAQDRSSGQAVRSRDTHWGNYDAQPGNAVDSLLAAEAAVATGASSAVNGARLTMQLTAEEIAGTSLPQTLAGYTRHGLNQAIGREGVGVAPRAILDAFRNPLSILGQSGGRFLFEGADASIVVNANGEVITTWATSAAGVRIIP